MDLDFFAFFIIGSTFAFLPITTGILGFIIPAFSNAMRSIVSPNIFVWSKLIEVIIDKIGVIIFVASNLPPRPVSIIAKSTFFLEKYKNAKRVVISKKLK